MLCHYSRLLRNCFKHFCGNSTSIHWSPFLLVTQVTCNSKTSPSFLWPTQINYFEFLLLSGIQTVAKSTASGCMSFNNRSECRNNFSKAQKRLPSSGTFFETNQNWILQSKCWISRFNPLHLCLIVCDYKVSQWGEENFMTYCTTCKVCEQFLILVGILSQKKWQDLLITLIWIFHDVSKALRQNSIKLHHYRKHSGSRICPSKLTC